MPRRDGTGPAGRGPLTGRGLGNCSGDNNKPSSFIGRGLGLGLGLGRRFLNSKSSTSVLEEQKTVLEEQLRNINNALRQNDEE